MSLAPSNPIVVTMYTTQVCPYCVRAKALLKQRGVEQIYEVRVDLDEGTLRLSRVRVVFGVRLARRTESGAGILFSVEALEPRFAADDEHALRVNRLIAAPFRPSLGRTTGMCIHIELVEDDGEA